MVTREDVDAYLLRMGLEYEEVEEGLWLVHSQGDGAPLVINHSAPLLVFRLKVMEVPSDDRRCAELYRKLLEMNVNELVHAAYGLEEGDVVLTASLQLENLDFNEFQANVDSFQMALATDLEELSPYRNC
jgi:hypothetical protein